MTGIGGAGTVTMGLIALPAMLSCHYDKRLASGCIVAGGALGILIPPSIIMIIYGMITGVSIGKLYAGGLFPGLLLSALFVGYILVLCKLKPSAGPAFVSEEKITWGKRFLATRDLIPIIILISVVLGTIFGGVCTPTEGAAIGAAGSLVCAALLHRLNWQILKKVSYTTLKLTGMVMWIVFGAYIFATVYIALGAPDLILELVLATNLGYWGVFIVVQILYFILGMLLDPGAIVMITAPISMPIVLAMGYDPVWFGVIFTMNMQMAFITPPFGYNLFYLKGVAAEDLLMKDIYLAIIPFVFLQAIALAIVMIFPQIALWLPGLFFGG
ncbi:C4-dicarboxylate TRAP transporter large permease protein DctM [subsurface metagenome]